MYWSSVVEKVKIQLINEISIRNSNFSYISDVVCNTVYVYDTWRAVAVRLTREQIKCYTHNIDVYVIIISLALLTHGTCKESRKFNYCCFRET